MKKNLLVFIIAILTITMSKAQKENNDFYDDAPTHQLQGNPIVEITGEIENPGKVDITDFPKRSIIVKEATLSEDGNQFIGAYRFDGYSLYDILNDRILNKANADEFNPIIDLFVIVEGANGESVVLSWGELYYPIHRHEIIIATEVARIVPSKTNELWPLPEKFRLIVAHDLITERNIPNPVRITVKSADISLEVNKGMDPMFAPDFTIFSGSKPIENLQTIPPEFSRTNYEAVFYGRGRGIHSTTPFNGALMDEVLNGHFPLSKNNIQNGFFIVAAQDGYRGVFTYSEVMNRNDQSEILIIEDREEENGGIFRLFPSCDFFSDRAIKSVNGIYFKKIE